MGAIKEQAVIHQEIELDDCWNRIGVWGKEKPRCPKMDQVIHCANCNVYSNAGRLLLDRGADQDYLHRWSDQLKDAVTKPEHNTMSVLVFRIAKEWLALPTRFFQEVVEMRVIHRIPHTKSPVLKGLVNIRGELQLCISLGALLGVEKGQVWNDDIANTIYARLVVISAEDMRFVFPVSEVRGIHRYLHADMQNIPATAGHGASNYMQGLLVLDKNHIGLLDEHLLLSALRRVLA